MEARSWLTTYPRIADIIREWRKTGMAENGDWQKTAWAWKTAYLGMAEIAPGGRKKKGNGEKTEMVEETG